MIRGRREVLERELQVYFFFQAEDGIRDYKVTGVQTCALPIYAKIARALFETEGTKLYPDATFTLRLSYGAVKGYRENGKHVAPFTTLGGLYARADRKSVV